MTKRLVDVEALGAVLKLFSRARHWERFHSPKNLAMALTGEVGELVEILQWLTEEQSRAVAKDPHTAQAIRDELADVLIYLVELATALDVDLNEAVKAKLVKNSLKYPAEPNPTA